MGLRRWPCRAAISAAQPGQVHLRKAGGHGLDPPPADAQVAARHRRRLPHNRHRRVPHPRARRQEPRVTRPLLNRPVSPGAGEGDATDEDGRYLQPNVRRRHGLMTWRFSARLSQRSPPRPPPADAGALVMIERGTAGRDVREHGCAPSKTLLGAAGDVVAGHALGLSLGAVAGVELGGGDAGSSYRLASQVGAGWPLSRQPVDREDHEDHQGANREAGAEVQERVARVRVFALVAGSGGCLFFAGGHVGCLPWGQG
jgi:hypothetical protein